MSTIPPPPQKQKQTNKQTNKQQQQQQQQQQTLNHTLSLLFAIRATILWLKQPFTVITIIPNLTRC